MEIHQRQHLEVVVRQHHLVCLHQQEEEVLLRHLHTTARGYVAEYQKAQRETAVRISAVS